MCLVYVLTPDGKPLMPCVPAIARLLLKEGKAKVVRRTPFTIKLLTPPKTTYTQPVTLGVDTGSAVVGVASADESATILYLSEVELRNDIATTMKERASKRRNRRNRQTRYRQPRWLNRRNSIKQGRLSPTMRSKIDGHLREIRFVKSILPISAIVLETGTFDPHALKNPEVLQNPSLYQKGINYGFANTKAYVLTRDSYLCQRCQGKSKDRRLEVHHLVFRSQGGSDDETNLLTLCKTCHDGLHAGLPKTHANDAAVIATRGKPPQFRITQVMLKKCIPDGDYQQTKGVRSEQPITTGKISGFRKFDKVRYCGQEYFIKGRMSTGYAILMGMDGKKVDLRPIPKFEKMKRVSARSSWMISQRIMPSVSSSTT